MAQPEKQLQSLERSLTAGVIGTAAYSAPELLLVESPRKPVQDAQTVLKSDVYSFGVTVRLCSLHTSPHA